jgi:hypothetical protein
MISRTHRARNKVNRMIAQVVVRKKDLQMGANNSCKRYFPVHPRPKFFVK